MVDDVPFIAVEMEAERQTATAQRLRFRTNLDEWVSAGRRAPSRLPRPPGSRRRRRPTSPSATGWRRGSRAPPTIRLVELCVERDDRGPAGARRLERRRVLSLRRHSLEPPDESDCPCEADILSAVAHVARRARRTNRGRRLSLRRSGRLRPACRARFVTAKSPGAACSPSEPITPAAVLVAVIERGRRALGAAHPPGRAPRAPRGPDQLSRRLRRPRGRELRSETALREAEEEIGLPASHRSRLSVGLDDYLVGTGYRITPVVGFVAAPPAFEAGYPRGRRGLRGAAPLRAGARQLPPRQDDHRTESSAVFT